jgi:pimeloyl-ACP methyl ester carboxylesterase
VFGIARRLAQDGYTVVVLSGPGAIGRGRARREPVGSWFAALRSTVHDLADSLAAGGCRGVGLLAGSLAAVPALRLLGPGSRFGAAAFVAPLFEASIPVTEPVRSALLDDPAIDAVDDATAKLRVPVLVVHGTRDEVVPLPQITRFCHAAGEAGLVERCLFESEGHIFLQLESWRRTQSAVDRFFAAHLA